MKGIPYSKPEFLFVLPLLKRLWASRDKQQCEELKKSIQKFRTIYHEQNDEMGVLQSK